jgi:flavin reductase (DIM6/NTAB) family NADH-FMN oxidoreductase RutF
MPMIRDDYRAIMRHQAGAVTVIACGAPGARAGLTATAVASLSDCPPTVLACVNRAAGAHDPIIEASAFSVNLLSSTQQPIAERFAGKDGLAGEARFDGIAWRTLSTGSPILPDALASLDCKLVEKHAFETHTIFIGRVMAGAFRADLKPLLYFRGDYWNLPTAAPATAPVVAPVTGS